jgi:hypothetical protein
MFLPLTDAPFFASSPFHLRLRVDLRRCRLRQLVMKLHVVTDAVEVRGVAAGSFAAWVHMLRTEALRGHQVLDALHCDVAAVAGSTRRLLLHAPELGGGVLEEEGERGDLEEELLGRSSTVPPWAAFPALWSLVVAYSRRKASVTTSRRRSSSTARRPCRLASAASLEKRGERRCGEEQRAHGGGEKGERAQRGDMRERRRVMRERRHAVRMSATDACFISGLHERQMRSKNWYSVRDVSMR